MHESKTLAITIGENVIKRNNKYKTKVNSKLKS